jgi:hypothetical protein
MSAASYSHTMLSGLGKSRKSLLTVDVADALQHAPEVPAPYSSSGAAASSPFDAAGVGAGDGHVVEGEDSDAPSAVRQEVQPAAASRPMHLSSCWRIC